MVKIMEKPIKMDDLEVTLFLETPISGFAHHSCMEWKHYFFKRYIIDHNRKITVHFHLWIFPACNMTVGCVKKIIYLYLGNLP